MSVERQIKIVHGSLIVLSIILGLYINQYWYMLAGIIGAGQIATGLTDRCGTRACLTRAPWNRA